MSKKSLANLERESQARETLRGLVELAGSQGDLQAARALSVLSPTERLAVLRREDAGTYSVVAALMSPKQVVETLLVLPHTWSNTQIAETPQTLVGEVWEVLTTFLFNAEDDRQEEIVKTIAESVAGTTMLALAILGARVDEEVGIDAGWAPSEGDDLGGYLKPRRVDGFDGPYEAGFVAEVLKRTGTLGAVKEVLYALKEAPSNISIHKRGLRDVRYFAAPQQDEENFFEPIF